MFKKIGFISLLGAATFTQNVLAADELNVANDNEASNFAKLGGAIRLRFDYDHNQDIRKFGLDTIILNGEFKHDQWSGIYEHRILGGSYPYDYVDHIGDVNFVKKAYLQYDFNSHANLQVGINQVPIGFQPYYTSSFIESLAYVAGLEDLYRAGLKYSYQKNNDQFLLGLYFANPWKGKGTSNGVYYSNVIVEADPSLEFGTDYKEKEAIAFQWNRSSNVSQTLHQNYGISLYHSSLASKTRNSADRNVVGAHYGIQNGDYNLKFQTLYQTINNDDKNITIGGYDSTLNMANKGMLYSLDLTKQLKQFNTHHISDFAVYVNYNLFDKSENSFNDTQRFVFGNSFTFKKDFFIATEFLLGKNDPYINGGYSQSFAGGGDNKWKNKLNINFGYYF